MHSWNNIVPRKVIDQALNKVKSCRVPYCPYENDIFKAFTFFGPDNCKAVFLGYDPYPQKDVATGILFANKPDTREDDISPSLRIIRDSVFRDLQLQDRNFDLSLEKWARQGILMINSALTVEMNRIGSHTMIWRPFTSCLLKNLSAYNPDILFVLFGAQAGTFKPYINSRSIAMSVPHPAYSARTGTKYPHIFHMIDRILSEKGHDIEWV